jgi:lipoyl-dependent peroxiredoxin
MPTRKAQAQWQGGLQDGRGHFKVESGSVEADYSFRTRFGDTPGSNPEELLGAAHAGCFSMALSDFLEKANFKPESLETNADVEIQKTGEGFAISRITLRTQAKVPGIDETRFRQHAEDAKANCPVSQALAGVDIQLEADLVQ